MEQLKEIYSSEVVLPLDSFLILNSFIPSDTSSYSYHYVMYVDSSECHSCFFRHLSDLNDSLMEYKQEYSTDFIIIIDSPSNEIDFRKRDFLIAQFDAPIYIDTTSIFRKYNSFVLNDNNFRNILIDNDNKVVLVGNPLKNQKIRDLFMEIITESRKSSEDNNYP